jgi:hypothetical protein
MRSVKLNALRTTADGAQALQIGVITRDVDEAISSNLRRKRSASCANPWQAIHRSVVALPGVPRR